MKIYKFYIGLIWFFLTCLAVATFLIALVEGHIIVIRWSLLAIVVSGATVFALFKDVL
jgi:hypothetical protein